jgi:P27 family predicted phage terminase small subunit
MAKLSIVPGDSANSTAPKHLKPATRVWFDEIWRSFELESQHVKILQLAAEAWDCYEAARNDISENGSTFKNKFGDVKPHPSVALMQNSRLAFLRVLRELNLDIAPPSDGARPKPLKYSR